MSFVLLGTEGCHLCDLAAAVIVAGAEGLNIDIYQEDIADSADGVEVYGTRIPVLRNERSGAEMDWPFDQEAAHQFLRESTERMSV